MKITTFVITLPEGVMLEHLYKNFLAHDTLLHYHRALARNDIVAYGPFEESDPCDVGAEEAESEPGKGSSSPAAAAAARDPALPFFKRKASVLMPLAAPRPLQLALGTSVIKLRLRQSVAVLRRAKVMESGGGGGEKSGGVEVEVEVGVGGEEDLAPLDVIEFRSAPRLWIPEAKDLSLGKISLVASYEDVVAVEEKEEGEATLPAAAAAAAAPLIDPKATPFHLSPRRRPRSRSASLAGNDASPGSPSSPPLPPPVRQRVRIDVTATADFRPEGWMATFKRPLESVMLAMVVKSARGMANCFASCAASDAGVGPLYPDLSKMPALVAPRLPRELSYLETRRISLDGPPGISRGLTVEESEELQESAARGSEVASAVAAAAAAAAAEVVAAEVAAENGRDGSSKAPVIGAAPPPPPPSLAEPVTPDRGIGANHSLARVSLASSVAESFHSAASELARVSSSSLSLDDDGEDGDYGDDGAAAAAKGKASSPPLAQPATPARGAPSADGKVAISLGGTNSGTKRVLRMPRWLVPGSGGGGAAPPRRSRSSASLAEQAEAAPTASSSASASASSSSRPKSAPGGSSNGREQQAQQARRQLLAWLRPKSARAS